MKPWPSVTAYASPWSLEVLPASASSRWSHSISKSTSVYLRMVTRAGFGYSAEWHNAGPMYTTTHSLTFPTWLVVVAFSALPAYSAIRRRQISKRDDESCENCGYNLTGNTSGVCPECGTRVPQKAKAIA